MSTIIATPHEDIPAHGDTSAEVGWEAERLVAGWLRTKGFRVKEMPQRDCAFDLLIDGLLRVEVKVAYPNKFHWKFNIHRHGTLSESKVDAYVLRLEEVPSMEKSLHLIMPAPLRTKTIDLSIRNLITTYGRYHDRFDFLRYRPDEVTA